MQMGSVLVNKIDYLGLPNLPSILVQQAARFGDAPFLWRKRDGQWHALSWAQALAQVQAIARGLIARGLQPGDRVGLISENRPEWLICDLAIMAAGGVTVPAYVTNTIDSHVHVFSDSGARMAFVSNAKLADRVVKAAQQAGLGLVIGMEADVTGHDRQGVEVISLDALTEAGKAVDVDILGRIAALPRDGLAAIIYTSGTGGVPTGVMLSHGNMICNAMGADDLLDHLPGFVGPNEIYLSFLPMSHSYEFSVGQFVTMGVGAQIYYAESLEKLIQNIAEVRPTFMTAVPRLYESIRGRILAGVEKQGGLKAKLFLAALRIGEKRYEDPSSLTFWEKLIDPVLDRLVRKKVADRFGGRLKAFVSGGAPLNYEVGRFFLALGVRILQGYGQTEAAPVVSCNFPHINDLSTIGPPLKGVEVKIAPDGEILVKGELVMLGYWRQPERTAQTVIDGWLHTGDIGEMDARGRLRITDRKKDIIVNSGGDNISPQRVEGMLCVEPEIAQAMVHGDRRPHLVGLIVPDEEWAKSWAQEQGRDPDPAALKSDPDFRKAVAEAIDRVNRKLSVLEKVRSFSFADEPFTIENAMLTPSMKIRRHVIRKQYLDRLEALYG